MADTFEMTDHRDPGFGLHTGNKPFAAPRDDDINAAFQSAQHGPDRGPVRGVDQLDGILRQAGLGQSPAQCCGDGQGGIQAFTARAEQRCIPRAQAQGRGICGDIGTGFVNDPDHAQRRPDTGDIKTRWHRPPGDFGPDRVGEVRHLPQGPNDPGHPVRRQGQAVHHGWTQALRPTDFKILLIGGDEIGLRCAEG